MSSLLDTLVERGISLWVEGERVRWRAPQGVVSEAELSEMRQRKDELREALAARPNDALDTFHERAAIAEHSGGLDRDAAERLAADEAGFADPGALFADVVKGWRHELVRRAERWASDHRGQEHIAAAIRFVDEGWGEKALALGWLPVELVGLCPRAPWARFDRMGAAYNLNPARAVTAETITDTVSLKRHRYLVNNDGGASLPW